MKGYQLAKKKHTTFEEKYKASRTLFSTIKTIHQSFPSIARLRIAARFRSFVQLNFFFE